jgi:hypothetical protein
MIQVIGSPSSVQRKKTMEQFKLKTKVIEYDNDVIKNPKKVDKQSLSSPLVTDKDTTQKESFEYKDNRLDKYFNEEKNKEVLLTHKDPVIAMVIEANIKKYTIKDDIVKFLHDQTADVVKVVLEANRGADDDKPALTDSIISETISSYVQRFKIEPKVYDLLKHQPSKLILGILPKICEYYGKYC